MASPEDSGEHSFRRTADYKIERLALDVERLAQDFHQHREETRTCLNQVKTEVAAVRSTVQAVKVAFWMAGAAGALVAWLLGTWRSIAALLK